MTVPTRIILILMLVLPLMTVALAAQPAPASAEEQTTTSAAPQPSDRSSAEIRREFNALLNRHPPELATILTLDPTLLSNEAFLNGYPELAKFVKEQPEVRRNPGFYLDQYTAPPRHQQPLLEEILQGIWVFCVMLLFAFVITWLIRMLIEQRRWSRLSRTQSEVHNKILDRFGTAGELLEYMRSPAGTRFLESAPIPLHPEPAQSAPLARVLWSIQIGIVVSAAAIGTLIVSERFGAETGQGLFALGIIGLSVGIGFIGSAFVSMFVSRRLGVWQPPRQAELGDSGLVR